MNTINYISKLIKINEKGRIVPFNYVFMFCSYSIGKEKLFLSVAEYFNFKVQVSEDKYSVIKCFSNDVIKDINLQVYEILKEHKKENYSHNSEINPIDRISTKESNFKIISLNHLTRDKLNNIVKNIKCDRILVILGTGWAGKPKYFDLIRKNRIIKKGIEIIQVPYSEHSSNEELIEFKSKMKYGNLCNTVKNKSSLH